RATACAAVDEVEFRVYRARRAHRHARGPAVPSSTSAAGLVARRIGRKQVVMMSRVRPVTPEERKQIIEALLAGESQNSIAKRLGRSQTTIYRIAKAEGIDSVNPPPKKANEARVKYARAGRIRVI